MVTRRTALFAVTLLLVCARAGIAQDRGDALSVELFATRVVLKGYAPATIAVDSFFALAGHAPPPSTASVRPRERQRALQDSLQRSVGGRRGTTVTVRASEPILRGSEARIFITVDEAQPAPSRRKDYETVGFVLDWRDGGWVIRERINLGQS
jgi:hypothetical protein